MTRGIDASAEMRDREKISGRGIVDAKDPGARVVSPARTAAQCPFLRMVHVCPQAIRLKPRPLFPR
jgi:hypothetical protein